MTDTKPRFFVFALEFKRDGHWGDDTTLTKILDPYEGHATWNDAKNWIDNYGQQNTEYTILEILKVTK